MRAIDIGERRARIAVRHRLAPATRATAPEYVAGSLVALHSSDPATVFLAARARLAVPAVADIERALYVDRSMIRMHGMRGTLFVFQRSFVPVVQAAAADAGAVAQRRRVLREIAGAGIATDPEAWLADVAASTLRALAARGEATANELGADEPRLRIQMRFNVGKRYEGTVGVSTRLLFLLALEGRIVRGRPAGTWISSQYRWLPIDAVLPVDGPPPAAPAARAEVVRNWLRAFGPATLADLRWWSGWTLGEIRPALAEVGAIQVDLDGAAGLVLPDDLEPTPLSEPFAAFLPGLDPTVMGWSDRRFFLGEHGPLLFDTNGNAGPTVWWDGRIVGGWAQHADGDVVHRLVEDVGGDGRAAIEAEAERLRGWLGPIRLTPRFRTPVERELSR